MATPSYEDSYVFKYASNNSITMQYVYIYIYIWSWKEHGRTVRVTGWKSERDEPWRRVATHWAAWTRKTGLREETTSRRRVFVGARLRRLRHGACSAFDYYVFDEWKSRGNGRVGVRGKVVTFDFARRWLIARNITTVDRKRFTVCGLYRYDCRDGWKLRVFRVLQGFFFSCRNFGGCVILFVTKREVVWNVIFAFFDIWVWGEHWLVCRNMTRLS